MNYGELNISCLMIFIFYLKLYFFNPLFCPYPFTKKIPLVIPLFTNITIEINIPRFYFIIHKVPILTPPYFFLYLSLVGFGNQNSRLLTVSPSSDGQKPQIFSGSATEKQHQ